jgi:nicotinamidase-related amidase
MKGDIMRRVYTCLVFVLLVALFWGNTYGSENQNQKQMKPVLLIIDIQNQFLPYFPEQEKKSALEMINNAIHIFRENNFPIIRIYHTDPQWGPKPDTEAFEFPASVNIKSDDPKIIKNYTNGFKKTDLEKIIREKEGNTLFLCGLSAVACVLATYHGAKDRDFDVFMIKDALISHDSTYTNFVEEIFDTVNLNVLKVMFKYAPK